MHLWQRRSAISYVLDKPRATSSVGADRWTQIHAMCCLVWLDTCLRTCALVSAPRTQNCGSACTLIDVQFACRAPEGTCAKQVSWAPIEASTFFTAEQQGIWVQQVAMTSTGAVSLGLPVSCGHQVKFCKAHLGSRCRFATRGSTSVSNGRHIGQSVVEHRLGTNLLLRWHSCKALSACLSAAHP